MYVLRPDQEKWISDCGNAFRTHQAVLGRAPTGFGKTVATSSITQRAAAKGRRVIFSVHRENLVRQTSGTFHEFGISHGFIASGMPYHREPLVHVASIDTLKRRLDMVEPADLLIVDEAHLARAAGWQAVVDYYIAKGAKVFGCTATPSRLDGQPLNHLFKTLVEGPSERWLMDRGHLSDYEYYAPDNPDLSKLKKEMGDFAQKGAGEIMDRPKLIGSVVSHYKSLAYGKRALCFAMNVKHSLHIVDEFNAKGIPAAHIDSKTPEGLRKQILHDFADGKILVLSNVELVTTGFDLSALVGRDVPVECVILCRPTMSLALFLQMVGRALRRKTYPAIILDHAGNSERHGFPDDEREWNLNGEVKTKGAPPEGLPPPVTCGGCFRQLKRPVPENCPHCKKRLVTPTKPVEVGEGTLIKVTDDIKAALRDKRKREDYEAKTLMELVALGAARGYASPQTWAFKKWSNSRSRHV